jgi:flavin-dependent dehydrogenase
MMRILRELKKQAVFSDFLKGGGILEAAIPGDLLFDLLATAGIPADHRSDFIDRQKELVVREMRTSGKAIAVFEDCMRIMGRIQNENK